MLSGKLQTLCFKYEIERNLRTPDYLFAHGFPTDDWSNLNWWELLNKAQVMNLLELPADYQSPIQPIDTWHLSRKLGMVSSCRDVHQRDP